jgi:hypothetical protein
MVLSMSRPFKHPKTGVYWLRKRLPADIAESSGRSIITKTLGTKLTVLDPHVSTRGEMGQLVLTVLGMVAQMERRFIKERQREGIEKARPPESTKAVSLGSTAPRSVRCMLRASGRRRLPKPSAARECRSIGFCVPLRLDKVPMPPWARQQFTQFFMAELFMAECFHRL